MYDRRLIGKTVTALYLNDDGTHMTMETDAGPLSWSVDGG